MAAVPRSCSDRACSAFWGLLLHLVREDAEAALCGIPRATLGQGGMFDQVVLPGPHRLAAQTQTGVWTVPTGEAPRAIGDRYPYRGQPTMYGAMPFRCRVRMLPRSPRRFGVR